jgi:hypothetical protein
MPNLSLITYRINNAQSRPRTEKKHGKLKDNISVVVKNLCKWCKAVSSATSIGDNIELWLVFLLVNTNNKHGSIFTGGRNDDLLCTTLD